MAARRRRRRGCCWLRFVVISCLLFMVSLFLAFRCRLWSCEWSGGLRLLLVVVVRAVRGVFPDERGVRADALEHLGLRPRNLDRDVALGAAADHGDVAVERRLVLFLARLLHASGGLRGRVNGGSDGGGG